MPETSINAPKITKPFQLLAAWFVALIVLEGITFAAAAKLTNPPWLSPMLAIAAIVYVIVIVVGVFIMQTRFRPEMLDDENFSGWLKSRGEPPLVTSATREVVQFANRETKTEARLELKQQMRYEVLPNRTRAKDSDTLSVECKLVAADNKTPLAMSGYTLVLLWNVYQVRFESVSFGTAFGAEADSFRTHTLLLPGVFNPSDPEYAAIIFSQYATGNLDSLRKFQSDVLSLVTIRFTVLTDKMIRFNPGFPYGPVSLLDVRGRPEFEVVAHSTYVNDSQ